MDQNGRGMTGGLTPNWTKTAKGLIGDSLRRNGRGIDWGLSQKVDQNGLGLISTQMPNSANKGVLQ